MRETGHAATSRNVFDTSTEFTLSAVEVLRACLGRYWYTCARPRRVELASTSSDLQYLNSYSTLYLQYNWHGHAATTVNLADGNGGSGWTWYDPWGGGSSGLNYYQWNGGWGYLWFNDLGLYYVHGRWWNQETPSHGARPMVSVNHLTPRLQ